jgi:YbbR domain-containing protein
MWLGWVLGDLRYKLLSVCIALLAWYWVQGKKIDEDHIRVELDWSFDSGLVTSDSLPDAVMVTIIGPRAAMKRAMQKPPKLDVDLGNIGVGEHQIDLRTYKFDSPLPNVRVLNYSPSVLKITLDERFLKKVPVEGSTAGASPVGYKFERITVRPALVEIEGPRSVVQGVERVRTQPIDLSEITSTDDVPVTLSLLPPGVITSSEWEGYATIEIRNLSARRQISSVPVVMMRTPDWQTVEGDETVVVVLEGPSYVINEMTYNDIFAVVRLPENSSQDSYSAEYEADFGPRYDIIHPRPDVVTVVETPDNIQVERR